MVFSSSQATLCLRVSEPCGRPVIFFTSFLVATSQITTVAEPCAASCLPSGEKTTVLHTFGAPASAWTSLPLAEPHSLTSWPRLGALPLVASSLPSGENAADCTAELCAFLTVHFALRVF